MGEETMTVLLGLYKDVPSFYIQHSLHIYKFLAMSWGRKLYIYKQCHSIQQYKGSCQLLHKICEFFTNSTEMLKLLKKLP